jgi:hypothetical protein
VSERIRKYAQSQLAADNFQRMALLDQNPYRGAV